MWGWGVLLTRSLPNPFESALSRTKTDADPDVVAARKAAAKAEAEAAKAPPTPPWKKDAAVPGVPWSSKLVQVRFFDKCVLLDSLNLEPRHCVFIYGSHAFAIQLIGNVCANLHHACAS